MSEADPTGPRPDDCLARRLERLAAEHGERTALIYGDSSVSFDGLAEEANRLAAALAGLGVSRGMRVGLLMPNRPEWLSTAFAVWRLGAVLVPINTLYRKAELRYALHYAEVGVLVMCESFLKNDYLTMLRDLCPELNEGSPPLRCAALPELRQIVCQGPTRLATTTAWEDFCAGGTDVDRPSCDISDDAAIFFTSGSTAAPKGVVHTHASMMCAADNVGERLGLDADDRTYGYLPMFFNGGLVGVALAALSRGGAVLLQDVFDAGAAIEMMRRHHCTTFFGWPHQADAILRHPSFDRDALLLRKGPGANAPWAEALLAPDHQCVGTWGMSETGPMATCTHHADPHSVRAGSHGRPMPGLEIRIVDEHNQPLAADAEGEIVVRGSSLMRTYYGKSPAECFDEQGFFHTGDLGRLDGRGMMHFAGRSRDVIKTAGVNVAAAEVESVLADHPQVRIAHVVPVPHPTRGENIAAFVVRATAELDEPTLLEHCRSELASYKVPRHVFFLSEEELPTLGSGKVDRRALRDRAAAAISKPRG